ncbi:odorant receptor 4 isoform X3 [Tribolium castaneum]
MVFSQFLGSPMILCFTCWNVSMDCFFNFSFTVIMEQGSQRRLPLSGWYPFNTDKSPAFELVYIYQILTTWIGGMGNISMDTFISGIIMAISSQLSILNNALKNITKNNELVRCVFHYRIIIKFSDEVIYLFNTCLTTQFIVGVIIVCISMFQMSLVPVLSFQFVAMLLYQMCILLEIFLWCFYGNEVMLKSDQLTQAAYMSDWTKSPNHFKQNLLFFMTRTQFPLKLYASGYFTLSLETFKAIVKSSWSYFAVLNQVHSRQTQ